MIYSWPLFLRLLRKGRGNWASFIGIYALGLSVFLMVDALSNNFRQELVKQSKEILEGDLRISARRPFTPAEEKIIDSLLPKNAIKAEVMGFLSMLRVEKSSLEKTSLPQDGMSRLVQAKAISPQYPLTGSFIFSEASQGKWSGKIPDLKSGEILFPHDLSVALKVKVGDTVILGTKKFRLLDEYSQRPGSNFDFWEMGSRVYFPLQDLPETGLEQKGSRIFRYRFYKFPAQTIESQMISLRKSLESALPDPEIEITTFAESGTELGKSFQMVTAFLKMISLSSFLLSAFGAVFFFRNHLISERKTVAILATLGLSRKNILRIYLQQNIFLSACAALLAILFALLWGRIFPQVIWHLYQFQLPASIPFKSMLGGFALSILTSIILGMASFISLFRIPPATLLKPLEGRKINRILALSLFFLQGFYFFAIAIGNSRSWMISSLSIGIMLGSLLLLGLFGWTLFQGLWKIRRYFHYGLRLALGNLRLGHEKSLLAFAALGFVTLSLSLIPQLQNLILNEIQSPQGRILPQLFLFDIQEDQAEPFSEFLSEKFKTEKSFHLDPLAPMIRARLEKVNGVNFDRENEAKGSVGKESTEEIRRRQIRNRGFNLSYRDSLSDAEVLVSGKFWEKSGAAGVNKITPPEFSYRESAAQENANLPEISVEKDYAARLNFKLGDHLLFDVQGVEVEGRITSLRKVRWTSFQPNFFVLFEPGALAEAPKTFLATLKGIPLDKLSPLQDEISAAFPNFTCLNLEEVIKKTVTLLNKMAMLIQLLSIFALGIGLTLLWLIVDSLIKENKTTTMLLRTLGETRKRMVFFYTLQFTSFCLSAGMAGYGLSLISVWVVNQFLWQVPWHPSLSIFLTCFIGSLTIGIACSVYAVYRGLNEPLRGLLSQMHN